MKLYADRPARRTRQILGDLVLLAWIWCWVRVALGVRAATLDLAEPGRQVDDSASGLAGWLRSAADKLGEIPLVGDGAAAPFTGAGSAADQLAAAGRAQVAAVESLAFWLTLAVAGIPIAMALLAYLPARVRFIRRATAGQRYLDDAADLELFALRAMAHQPLHVLARVSPDPVAAWRTGDRKVIGALAALELSDVGLRAPASVLE